MTFNIHYHRFYMAFYIWQWHCWLLGSKYSHWKEMVIALRSLFGDK
jgi:hypothetical protein